jgi:glycosyltransferase involved in cell wall biosynthesis
MLTIVSSFYNEESGVVPYFIGLKNCLVLHQDVKAILVNNGSKDQTLSKLNSQYKGELSIVVLDNPNPGGYGLGVNYGISQADTSYVLILPSDLQFQFGDVNRLISTAKSLCADFESKHANIFTKRKRLDGVFASIRGIIWSYIVSLFLRIPRNLDPASQLKLLCRCCIPSLVSSDFMWDLELSYKLINTGKTPQVIDVDFQARIMGKSSVSSYPIRTEVEALKKLIKLSLYLRKQ